MASWPNAQEYTASVSNPRLNFLDPEIRLATPELTNLQIPRPRSGTYAVVYHLQGPQSDFAIRCFLKDFADQQERYAAISQTLKEQTLKASGYPFTVTFEFLSQGIQVNRKWYPVLKMAWVKGEQLNRYIESNLRNPNKLIALANQLKEIIDAMQQRQIAHCDLQNGNILVSNDRLFLIDYDGMYVPQLFGRGSHEQGHPNFQHPLRSGQHFGPTTDNFSAWVIYFSLIALSLDPALWQASGAKDNPDQLLFKRKDFDQPNSSSTLRLLASHPNPTIQGLGILFQSMLFYDVDRVPSLDQDPTSAQSNIITPAKQQPTWLKNHAKQTNSTTPNSSTLAANPPTSSTMAASSWIIDSLAAGQNVVPRNFIAPLIIPRITVFTSATAIVISLVTVFIIPAYLFPILAGAALLMAVNMMILTITFDKDPAIREARLINAEIQQQNLELAAIVKMRAETVKQKEDLNNQFAESVNDLKQQQTDLKAAEQKEIDGINTQFQTIFTGLKQQLADLKAAEQRECDQINTPLQTLLSALYKQQTELKAAEQREIDQVNQVLTALSQQQMSLKDAERREMDQINNQLQTMLSDFSFQTQKLRQAESSELNDLQRSIGSRITQIDTMLQTYSSKETAEISSALSTIRTQHVQSYMQRQHISCGGIPGIGEKLSASLAQHGYRTAADINSGAYNVPGIGSSKAASLEAWWRHHDAEARRHIPTALSSANQTQIKAKYALEKNRLESDKAKLQVALNQDERAVRYKYQLQLHRLNEDKNIDQINADKKIKAIQIRYSQSHSKLDQERSAAQIDVNHKTKAIQARTSQAYSKLTDEKNVAQINADSKTRAIQARYSQAYSKLTEQKNVAQINTNSQIKAIQARYSLSYSQLDKQIADQSQSLANDLADFDKRIRDVEKQVFAAQLRIAKAKQQLESYRKLTFNNYIRKVLLQKAA